MAEKTTFKESALRAIAILGLIAILLLGAWGIIQLAFTLSGFFGSAGGTPTPRPAAHEQITLSAPAKATAGQPFTVSWNHAGGTGNYSYAVSYSCASGLSMQAPVPTGGSQNVACGTPFNYTDAMQNLQLTPKLTGSQPQTTVLTVYANQLSTGSITAQGSTTLSVLPASGAAASGQTTRPAGQASYGAGTPNTTTSYVPSAHRAALHGLPDLAVSIISATPHGAHYTVQFVVQNVGTNSTPAGWTFNAALPLNPVYTFRSQPQQALYPGDKIVYTLGFDAPTAYIQPAAPYTGGCSYGYPCTAPAYPYPANCGYGTNYTYNGVFNYPSTSYGCSSSYTSYSGSSFPNYYANYSANYANTYPANCVGYTPGCIGGGTYGAGVFTVSVDPYNLISESNEANNAASVTLAGY